MMESIWIYDMQHQRKENEGDPWVKNDDKLRAIDFFHKNITMF